MHKIEWEIWVDGDPLETNRLCDLGRHSCSGTAGIASARGRTQEADLYWVSPVIHPASYCWHACQQLSMVPGRAFFNWRCHGLNQGPSTSSPIPLDLFFCTHVRRAVFCDIRFGNETVFSIHQCWTQIFASSWNKIIRLPSNCNLITYPVIIDLSQVSWQTDVFFSFPGVLGIIVTRKPMLTWDHPVLWLWLRLSDRNIWQLGNECTGSGQELFFPWRLMAKCEVVYVPLFQLLCRAYTYKLSEQLAFQKQWNRSFAVGSFSTSPKATSEIPCVSKYSTCLTTRKQISFPPFYYMPAIWLTWKMEWPSVLLWVHTGDANYADKMVVYLVQSLFIYLDL